MHRAIAILLFALVAFPAFADTCSKPDFGRIAASVEAAQSAIVDSLPKQDLDPGIPARSRKAIAAMQDRLRLYLAASLRCAPGARALEKKLRWGAPDLQFAVRSPREDMLAVTASFNVGCGNDTVLAIFARHGDAWQETLYAHAKLYRKVSGAWGSFDYAVSLPDKEGHWFAVTKTVAPWCSSTWSSIDYAVFRPGAASPIFSAEDPIWWGGEDFGRLKAGRDDFELRFHAESIDGGVHNREWVRRFSVLGGKVVRIAPFADTPRDFMEEWVKSEWKDAVSWTAPALVPRVRELHDKFRTKPYGEFQSIRACGTDVLQIEVQPDETDSSLYFEVSGKSDFRLTGLSDKPDARCTGKNLYDIDKPNNG